MRVRKQSPGGTAGGQGNVLGRMPKWKLVACPTCGAATFENCYVYGRDSTGKAYVVRKRRNPHGPRRGEARKLAK